MRILKEGITLYPDQIENAKRLVTRKRALFIDSTGSGKTFTVLYAFAYLYSKKLVTGMLVCTPRNAHEKEVWKPQIQQFTNFRCIDFETIEKERAKGRSLQSILDRVHIVYMKHTSVKCNYPLVVDIIDYFERPLTLIDEVHAFKNPKSELSTKMSMALTHTYALWGITATDLSKNVMDVYHIISFVYPNKLGNRFEFIRRFCNTKSKVIGRFADGRLKKAEEVIGIKSIDDFREYLKDTLVIGSRTVDISIHIHDYFLSTKERDMYSRIANGLLLNEDTDDESWIKKILSRSDIIESPVRSIKDVERHSSRYIYLQSVVDGSLNQDGSFGFNPSSKSTKLLELVSSIAAKDQSALIYFDYYTSLDNVYYQLSTANIKDSKGRPIKLIESSARKQQKSGFITKSMCSLSSYFILCSKAASESENFPFINNVILYDVPITPVTYLQFIGRITRRNTLYPGDLHAHILLSDSIDTYKLTVIGRKLYEMQSTTYDLSGSFPQEYMKPVDDIKQLDAAKKHLLWKSY